MEDVRNEITYAYEFRIADLIDGAVSTDIIQEINILATHYWVDGTYIDDICVLLIDESIISVEVPGSVVVEHQYGSNGDYSRGDGARMESSYPMIVSISIDVRYPLDFTVGAHNVRVDNSGIYE
ncbi:hypothetical protein [Rossellomorea marisflavi]|uniref:pPIWI-associating nuclease domain-containing protein n=1 Tax=Rossellomorea marisflavi TaxID=189381 RepID=UPI0018CF17EF|nr:hypothetical protein [Rossellomorea marisflavi]